MRYIHSSVIALAILLTVLCAWVLRRAQKTDNSAFFPTALCAVTIGVIFSRLLYAYFFPEPFRADLTMLIRLPLGGYSLLGGMAGAVLAVWLMSKFFCFDAVKMLDALCPAGMLGIAVGRTADYFTAENVGVTVTDEKYQRFPFGVFNAQTGTWSVAVMLFAAAACMVSFFVLLGLFARTYSSRKNPLCRKGDVVFGFMLLFGTAQTVLESMRVDALYFNSLGFVKVMQIAAILMAAAVMVVMSVRSVRVYGRPVTWHYLYWGMMVCSLAAAMWAEFRMSVGTMTRNYTVMISGLFVPLLCTIIMYFNSTDAEISAVRNHNKMRM